MSGSLGDSPIASLVPLDELAFGLVALYLGLELLTELDGDRAPAEALLARLAASPGRWPYWAVRPDPDVDVDGGIR